MDHPEKTHIEIVIERGFNDYLKFFKNFSLETIGDLDAHMVDQVYYSDPFNTVTGKDELKEIWQRYFEVTKDTRITISTTALNGDQAFVSWDMTYKVPTKKKDSPFDRLSISGVSELKFDPAGRLVSRIDYWDAASRFYEKLPIVGQLVRFFKSRLQP